MEENQRKSRIVVINVIYQPRERGNLSGSFYFWREMLKYYLAYNGKRVNVPLSRDEAFKLLMETKGAVKGLSIMVYDEKGKFIREMGRDRHR